MEWLVPEARRGRPGPAAEAALRAAESDPAHADDHRVEAACALLVGGEPRAADQLLDDVNPKDARLPACRAWASALENNWYPGGEGGELGRSWQSLDADAPRADGEAGQLEMLVLGAIDLHAVRALAEGYARHPNERIQVALQYGARQLEQFAGLGVPGAYSWAHAALADLMWRLGDDDAAAIAEQGDDGDPVSRAVMLMTQGDWYATPGSWPEALGYDLADQHTPSPRLAARDLDRARALYDEASASAAGAAPRVTGALALRRAALAWQAGGADLGSLDEATAGFLDAGDAAGVQTVAVHRVLAELRAGPVAGVRLRSGTSWDMAPRGAIAGVLAWAGERGSPSYALGLGRLLQRAAGAWQREGDLDRAAVALSMALPLQSVAGPWWTAAVLEGLAALDGERQLPVRQLVRLEQALRIVPEMVALGEDTTSWMRLADLVSGVLLGHSRRGGSSSAGRGIAGFEQAIERTRAVAALPGVPIADVVTSMLRDSSELLQQLRGRMFDHAGPQMMAFTAQSLRDSVNRMTPVALMQRGWLAQQAGATVAADAWFADAIAKADTAGAEYEWVTVLVNARWRRYDEARRRLEAVHARGLVPDDLLFSLSIRARVFEVAREVVVRLEEPTAWSDLADRAELELETGDPSAALALSDRAIADLEATVAAMARDADRLSHTDSVSVLSVYLIAARAAVACGDPGRALEYADRVATLTMANLAAVAEQVPVDGERRRAWQQAATEWAAAFERLLHAYETGDAAEPETRAADLARADDALIALEADLEARQPGVLAAARRLATPPDWDALRSGLPDGACVVQYLLQGRDLLAFAMTRSGVAARRVDVERLGVEGRVREFWRGCAEGAPAALGEELASVLLEPVADVLRAYPRVVVVPSGSLAAVAFHALPFDGRPLGADHVVSYLPASSLLAGKTLDAPLAEADAVVVGDPAFDPDRYPDLRRLPGAALEARAVGRRWGSDAVLVGPEASEPAVRAAVGGRSIVHLAAHGHLDDVAPSLSALVLAGMDELTVADLIGLRLDTDLAVLSACDSGRGVATLGGDVVGLTRGLMTAGVRRAVVSLWPVDDDAAAVTMDLFHERLAAGSVPAVALCEAQATMRGLSAGELARRYLALGGGASDATSRRGAPLRSSRQLALDPEFVDDLPLDLGGPLERTWAPFVLVGT